jgi:negative regulator of sigma E activity
LLDLVDPSVLAMFERVYTSRLTGARMHSPNDPHVEQALIDALINEANEGHVPLQDGQIRKIMPVPTAQPATTTESTGTLADQLQRYRIPVTIGAAVFAVVFVVIWVVVFFGDNSAAAMESSAPSASPSASASASAAPRVRQTPLLNGKRDTTPASVDVAGTVYRAVETMVQDRRWVVDQSAGVASWLHGTIAHPVFCVASLDGVQEGDPVIVRDITGVVYRYTVAARKEVQAHQIEILAPHTIGLTLLQCGNVGDVRTAVTATLER